MKQEEKSLLSKGKIIDAAMKLFLEKGYELVDFLSEILVTVHVFITYISALSSKFTTSYPASINFCIIAFVSYWFVLQPQSAKSYFSFFHYKSP